MDDTDNRNETKFGGDEIIEITTDGERIHCRGQADGGHPRVFLRLHNGRAVCPYCGRRFIGKRKVAKTSPH